MALRDDVLKFQQNFAKAAPGTLNLINAILEDMNRFSIEADPAKRTPIAFSLIESAENLFPRDQMRALATLGFVLSNSEPSSRESHQALKAAANRIANGFTASEDIIKFTMSLQGRLFADNAHYQTICRAYADTVLTHGEDAENRIAMIDMIREQFTDRQPEIRAYLDAAIEELKNPSLINRGVSQLSAMREWLGERRLG